MPVLKVTLKPIAVNAVADGGGRGARGDAPRGAARAAVEASETGGVL